MFSPPTRTARISGLYLVPPQVGQGLSSIISSIFSRMNSDSVSR